MSKEEHAAAASVLRGAARHADRPWYRSAERVLARHSLRGLACLIQYVRVRSLLDRLRGRPEHDDAVARLREARRRGWLDEHLMLKALADEVGP